jgi:hypothetical protein
VHLDRVRRGVRRALAPELVDQPVDRDGLSEAEREAGEERPRLRAAELDEAVAATDLERSEETEVERSRVGRLRDVTPPWFAQLCSPPRRCLVATLSGS